MRIEDKLKGRLRNKSTLIFVSSIGLNRLHETRYF